MISITRYRVWPDGAVQEADTPAHHWKSDDYELVEAPTPEDAWARAKANAPMVPELNYAALCDAAFLQDKRWAQGTTGCVAFARGAEWYRDQLLATGPHTLYKTNDPEAPAAIRARNGEVVLSLCKVCGKAEGELGEPCHAPAVPQGWKLVQTPITEEMHVAAVKVLHRAPGLAGLPQRMLDAMLAATPAHAPAQEQCNACLGTGRMVRDPDIGTDQECFVCDGSGYEPAQEVGLTEAQTTHVRTALQHAWQLGQVYWQQADSNYTSEHKKSDETQQDFEKFCDDTIAALLTKGGK